MEKKTTKTTVLLPKYLKASEAVLGNLRTRKGFDEIFKLISPQVSEELKTTIANIIKESLV